MKVKDEEKNIKKVETQNKIVKTKHENTDNLAESKEEIKKDVKIETKQKELEKDVETEAKQKEIKKDAKIEKKQKDPEKNVETETKQKELEKDAKKEQEKKENTTEFKPIENTEEAKTNKSDVLVIFGILLAIVILLVTVVYGTFSIMTEKSTTIAKGVYIKNIDVSGLTREQAKEKINNYISSVIPEEIKLTHNGFETSLSTSQLSIYFNTDEAVDMAYNIGKTGNIFQKNLTILQTRLSKTTIDPGFSIDMDQLKKDLEDISSKLPDKIIESSCYIDGNKLIITKGKAGKTVKVDDSAKYIKQAINDLKIENNSLELLTEDSTPKEIDLNAVYNEIHKEPVNAYYSQNPYVVHPSENGMDFSITLDEAKNMLKEEKDEYVVPLKVLYPSVTTNMIGTEAFPDLLSEFSTKYAASNKNRTTNLILAAKKINGTVLMPGETFSYNKVVGARTIQAGYKEAPIYVSGRVEDGIGGGICQITTTLYNAVVYANLDIVERSNHQFVPSYAGPSRDATVVYGAIDFKFKNNRDYPIKIACSVSGGIANFKIWGLKSDNDYEVQISSRTTGKTSTAIYSEAYKILKKNGNVVSTTLLSKDTYKRH
jgi:vancomycin resistance protein YoaR